MAYRGPSDNKQPHDDQWDRGDKDDGAPVYVDDFVDSACPAHHHQYFRALLFFPHKSVPPYPTLAQLYPHAPLTPRYRVAPRRGPANFHPDARPRPPLPRCGVVPVHRGESLLDVVAPGSTHAATAILLTHRGFAFLLCSADA